MSKKIIQRFNAVLNEIYHGNQSVMSRDLGVDPSMLSRYKSGQVIPNVRTLKFLANLKSIRFEWLLGEDGDDDKIAYTGAAAGFTCPPYSRPVMPWPTEAYPTPSTSGFTGLFRETAPHYAAEDHYWLAITEAVPHTKIDAGGYVLVKVLKPHRPATCEVGKIVVLKANDERPRLAVLQKSDLRTGDLVCGMVVLDQRDYY